MRQALGAARAGASDPAAAALSVAIVTRTHNVKSALHHPAPLPPPAPAPPVGPSRAAISAPSPASPPPGVESAAAAGCGGVPGWEECTWEGPGSPCWRCAGACSACRSSAWPSTES